MEYKRRKLLKEDIEQDGSDTIKEIGDEIYDWLTNQNVKFGSTNIIFLVEYCQLWCYVEPLYFFEDSELMQRYRDAINKRNKTIGEFVDWNNSSYGIVVADNANQAVQKFLKEKS